MPIRGEGPHLARRFRPRVEVESFRMLARNPDRLSCSRALPLRRIFVNRLAPQWVFHRCPIPVALDLLIVQHYKE